MTDHLLMYENVTQVVTLAGVAKKKGRRPTLEDLGVIENAAVVVDTNHNRIEWLGEQGALPKEYRSIVNTASGDGEVWLPELVECHTHLVHAGTRHHDYSLRCAGKTYQEVAHEGGGILRTLAFTRDASFAELLSSAQAEIDRFQRYGVGTLEIKSGYGLSLESELKILEVIQALKESTSVHLVPTFLPAHAVPPEFRDRTDDYVDVICREWIPAVTEKKWAKFFDVFIEEGYFSLKQAEKLCMAALDRGLGLKLHCDQFTDLGGARLGVDLGAQSVDHLDNISADSIKKVAASETVAVLCPGASLFTGTPYAPARKLIDAGARVAVSTDYNPGTCPSRNLPLMTTIACSQMKMTVAEALAAITYNAAAALGLENEVGTLEAGKAFRACHLKADSFEVLPYCFGDLE